MTHLHVVGVRLGAVVGHTRVHGVLGRHLVQFREVGGWGLEETERPCVYITLQFVVRAMLTTMKQLVSNYIVHSFHH